MSDTCHPLWNWSQFEPVTEPIAPSSVTAEVNGVEMTVRWVNSEQPAGYNITNYKITSEPTLKSVLPEWVKASDESVTVVGDECTSYVFIVQAYDANMHLSSDPTTSQPVITSAKRESTIIDHSFISVVYDDFCMSMIEQMTDRIGVVHWTMVSNVVTWTLESEWLFLRINTMNILVSYWFIALWSPSEWYTNEFVLRMWHVYCVYRSRVVSFVLMYSTSFVVVTGLNQAPQ